MPLLSLLALPLVLSPQGCEAPLGVDALGMGTAGTAGVPRLENEGAPLVGTPHQLRVRNGLPGSTGVLIAGTTSVEAFLPQYAGFAYVGSPLVLVEPFVVDGDGSSAPVLAQVAVPAIACGVTAYAQAAVLDPAATGGFALTQGLAVRFGVDLGPRLDAPLFQGFGSGFAQAVRSGDIDHDGALDLLGAYEFGATAGIRAWLGDGAGFFEDGGVPVPITGPTDLVLADLDGDGTLDVAAPRTSVDRVGVSFGAGDGSFAAPVDEVVDSPSGLAVADFDADGDLDLIAPSEDADELRALVNLGAGTYVNLALQATNTQPRDVAVGDFNGDGFADAVTTGIVSDDLAVFLNDGSGALLAPVLTATGEGPDFVTAAQVDGDGVVDLVVACRFSDDVWVMLGDGAGGFSPSAKIESNDPSWVEVTDLDSDSLADVVIASTALNYAAFWGGVGDGTFLERDRLWDNEPSTLTSADFNGDGAPDLALLGRSLSLRLGIPADWFALPEDYPTNGSVDAVAIGDVTGDGRADLVAADRLTVFPGTGGDQLGAGIQLTTDTFNSDVLTFDADGDGVQDVVVADRFGGVLETRLALGGGAFAGAISTPTGPQPEALAAGDLDGDGTVDVALVLNNLGLALQLGNGDGTFQAPSTTAATSSIESVALGDIDLDGNLDAVAAFGSWSSPGGLQVFFGAGDGSVSGPTLWPSAGGVSVTVADLDADGVPDLASGAGSLYVSLGEGGSVFAPPAILGPAANAMDVEIGDLSGDGVLDVVVGCHGFSTDQSGRVAVFDGVGDGSFLPARSAVYRGPDFGVSSNMALGDLNGDGVPDVAMPNPDGEAATVFLNRLLD